MYNKTFGNYIDGVVVEGKSNLIEVVDPSNEDTIASFRGVDREQTEAALKAAETAFKTWGKMSINQRIVWINKLADALEEEQEEIIKLLSMESGKMPGAAGWGFSMLIKCLKYFPEELKRLNGSIITDYDNSFIHQIIREPIGVVVGYLAWNFPLLNLGYKLGPVLASGCTCVLKPSSMTPLATLYVGEVAARIGFPKGVINIIAGSGKEVGSVLNSSKIPKMLTLIGSTDTGKELIAQSATSVKHFSLELGGNAPAIVTANADTEAAAGHICGLKFSNCGQICVSPNRIYVHKSVHKKFMKYAVELASKYIPSSRDLTGDSQPITPMISKKTKERMFELIEDARKKGGKIVYGGKAFDGCDKGYYLMPTIIDNADMSMKCCNDEIFGPIMPVIVYDDTDEMLESANNTEYGLASYVFSDNLSEVTRISNELNFGTVCVNQVVFDVYLPHGGFKNSGIGKDCSIYSLEEYLNIKRISIKK